MTEFTSEGRDFRGGGKIWTGEGARIFLPSDRGGLDFFYPPAGGGGLLKFFASGRGAYFFFAAHFSKKCLKSPFFFIFGGFEAFYYSS